MDLKTQTPEQLVQRVGPNWRNGQTGSLLAWLRSRGGDNPYAEDVVGSLLGHSHLHEPTT